MKNKLWVLFFLSSLYSLFSYALTDPNLILTSWQPYWQFQQWMWQTFFHDRFLLTTTYILLISSFLGVYFWGLTSLKDSPNTRKEKETSSSLFVMLLFALSPLFFSYNALSHDVFNYMFNAKMVTVYHANPHIQTALDFSYDDWTRFMHNTHTPAPYGYGWTAFSVVPSLLGFQLFLPTWFLFKVWAWGSFILLFWSLRMLAAKLSVPFSVKNTWLVFANPLVFLEILSNLHNDFWMLIPAIVSLALVIKPTRPRFLILFLSAALLGFSISTKLATVVLVPFWLFWTASWLPSIQKKLTGISAMPLFPLLISLSLFLPLLTARSQQFLPWYLTWSLIWLPFISLVPWKQWLIALSIASLFRSVPWLWAGGFEGQVLYWQKMITWGGAGIIWVLSLSVFLFQKSMAKSSESEKKRSSP